LSNPNIASLGLFAGDEHQPFYWEGGEGAVLLIHGFMGTPAEMRPLAQEFHIAEWTVQGLLLPGFGPQIDTLFDRHYQEWIKTTRFALEQLREKHEPVLLIGYSMGAAVAINVAINSLPDKMILLAPFSRIGNTFHRIIWQFVKRPVLYPQPFKKADFTNARIRQYEAVKPARTRQLATLFPGTIKYLELEADHGIVNANGPSYQQMTGAILRFTGTSLT
jgi:esterase/lipase